MSKTISARAPLRASFFGGGSDFPSHFLEHGGMVLSAALSLGITATVRYSRDATYRVGTGNADAARQPHLIDHQFVRESIQELGFFEPVEVDFHSDVRPDGTGLGTSSALTCALLAALSQLNERPLGPNELAEMATRVERGRCGRRTGLQDQYASAFGGINTIAFHTDGSVDVTPLPISAALMAKLCRHLLLVDTGISRDASAVAATADRGTLRGQTTLRALTRLTELASEIGRDLLRDDIAGFGNALDEAWRLKSYSHAVSDGGLSELYQQVRKAGAEGGKLLGAGRGGHMLLFVPPERREAVIRSVSPLRCFEFAIDMRGTEVLK
jgi:D-glycero-alpha-D-manno-heptose-7-phosphate kinase